jgi:hypothetical protein
MVGKHADEDDPGERILQSLHLLIGKPAPACRFGRGNHVQQPYRSGNGDSERNQIKCDERYDLEVVFEPLVAAVFIFIRLFPKRFSALPTGKLLGPDAPAISVVGAILGLRSGPLGSVLIR